MSEKPAQIKALEECSINLRERFEHYMIIAKDKDGHLCFKQSDRTWGLGAVMRIREIMLEWDRQDERDLEEHRDE